MLLLKNTIELVNSFFYLSFEVSKSQMAAKLGQKIISDTKSIDVPFLWVI